jgi:hypothetical protein
MVRARAVAIALCLLGARPLSAGRCSTGAQITNISDALRESQGIVSYVAGALVRSVRPNSPASRAGLRPRDVIQAVGTNLIQNVCDYEGAIEKFGCGHVELTVRRDNSTIVFDVKLAEIPPGRFDDQNRCLAGDGAACTSLARKNDLAVDLLRLACSLGDAEGCFLLGVKLGNNKEGRAAYEAACDFGNPDACTNLGYMYDTGEGAAKDYAAAIRLYRHACRGSLCTGSDSLGCINLGRVYNAGRGVPKDEREALRLFKDVCGRAPKDDEDREHITRSCALAGTLLVFGDQIAHEPKEGIDLLDRACAAADSFACYNLGVVYERGDDVPADNARALALYQKSCERGDSEACSRVEKLKETVK